MKKANHRKNLPLQLGLLLLVVVVLFTGYTLAKYFTEMDHENAYVAKNFYFESDLLDGSTHTLQPGADSVSFVLMNYPDSLRVSEVAIPYTVSITGPVNDSTTGTLPMVKQTDTITFDNLTPGTYTVTANATSPYTKTLTATFVIPASESAVSCSVSDGDGSPVCYLTISVGDYAGPISVNLPAGVILDPTETLVTNVTPNTEYRYTFFKSEPGTVYTDTSFTVSHP